MANKIIFNDTTFDDITDYDGGVTLWSQICNSCTEKHNIDHKYLDEDAGHGICGVEGCENESDHYIDFPEGEYKLIID